MIGLSLPVRGRGRGPGDVAYTGSSGSADLAVLARPAKRERRSTGKLRGRPAGRPGLMCTGAPARRCGTIRHCQLTAFGTGWGRARPG